MVLLKLKPQNQIQIWPNRLLFWKEKKRSSSNNNNGWETSVNGISVIEHHVMVGLPKIFMKIVTTKDLPWSWSKLMILYLVGTLTRLGQVRLLHGYNDWYRLDSKVLSWLPYRYFYLPLRKSVRFVLFSPFNQIPCKSRKASGVVAVEVETEPRSKLCVIDPNYPERR